MRIAVTGADGFLGWHVRCRCFASGLACVPIDRHIMNDAERLHETLQDVDAVLHCAGVNRGSDSEIMDGNVGLARQLANAVSRLARPVRLVYANSVQSSRGGIYGDSKRCARDILELAVSSHGGLADVLLPNLYGEHARPHYNSFVATFCHEVAQGREPQVVNDREIPLLHVQDAAAALLNETCGVGNSLVEPTGEPITISAVLARLHVFDATYRCGELPDVASRFRARLFNTYRSYLFPARYPLLVPPRVDARGALVECVRTGDAGGQAFMSTTVPGAVRGEHVHLRKFERFLVVDGEAVISLRRLFTDDVMRFPVSGATPAIVDMPTMWVHNIVNIGDRPVTTFFWTNELFSPHDPDSFACPVDRLEAAA